MTVSATRVIRSCKRHAMASLKTLTVETLKGRLGPQTDQSRAAGAHTLIRSRPDSDRGGAFELQ
jgi:hypothetical protein